MKEAWETIRHKDFFNEFTLMLLASLGAFYIGEYPEAVAVMLFYAVGEMFQDRAVDKARSHIKSLLDVRPQTATVRRDGQWQTVAPETVGVGEEIEVKTGERVPLDGVLLEPETAFNTAALTGESVPCMIGQDEEVLAGMIPTERVVRLRTVRGYTDSALSRILDMVQNAASRKAPTEQFIRRFARIYTPAVTMLALHGIPVSSTIFRHGSTGRWSFSSFPAPVHWWSAYRWAISAESGQPHAGASCSKAVTIWMPLPI